MEGKNDGAKLITLDPRMSNTASKSDLWMTPWPGSETTMLLAIANYLIQNDRYDKDFVNKWVNWQAFLDVSIDAVETPAAREVLADIQAKDQKSFEDFDRMLKALYAEFTFEKAAEEAQIDASKIEQAAKWIAECEGRLATHTWRSASIGNEGGWQVARALFCECVDGQRGHQRWYIL